MTAVPVYGMDPGAFAEGVAHLTALDARLANLHRRNGDPPRWARPSTFASMVLFVLEQQVSLASAKAAFLRLHEAIGSIDPVSFLRLDDDRLRTIGFSRQKASYCRGIAERILGGDLDLGGLHSLDDDEARQTLTSIRGVGRWTADVYLLFVLGRPDAWPSGDRALYVSMSGALDLDGVPDPEDADRLAEHWRPWRGIAAFLLWHDYLGGSAYQDDGVLADILG